MRISKLWRTLALALALALLAPLLAAPNATEAADPPTYYKETGHYLGGVFRDYWQKNGGLYVFGYPLTEEYVAANGRVTQYFERARFELFPEYTNTPFLVQLGLLGIESTAGRVFPQSPPRANDADHRYFPETHHLVMWGFKTIWESRGGLAMFGYPISEEMMEILPADGKWHVVQYFERARFEYWPNFKPGQRVLISDLGRRQAPRELMPPLPPGTPPGTVPPGTPPAPGTPGVPTAPPNVNATVTPPSGPQGTEFAFNATGFEPGEEVSLWATAPDQAVLPADFTAVADDDGTLTSSEIGFGSNDNTPTGVWAITAQGNRSNSVAIGYFVITGNAPPPPPAPPTTPGLPDNKNARTEPREGPPGTTFYFFADGFVPGEQVAVTLLNDQSQVIANVLQGPADQNGSIDYAGIYLRTTPQTPPGVYRMYAQSESGREAYAWLRLTPATNASLGYRLTAKGDTVRRGQQEFGLGGNFGQ